MNTKFKIIFFNLLKQTLLVGVITFVFSFLQFYWAMGGFSSKTSSGCLDCSFFEDVFFMSLLTSIFLAVVFQILYLIKNKYVKITIQFLLIVAIWLFWNYTVFVDRESSWSTYVFNEEIFTVLRLSFLPVFTMSIVVLTIFNFNALKKSQK